LFAGPLSPPPEKEAHSEENSGAEPQTKVLQRLKPRLKKARFGRAEARPSEVSQGFARCAMSGAFVHGATSSQQDKRQTSFW
jgi:hypothetical protein